MNMEKTNIYPNCSTILRNVEVGGLTKSELRLKLQHHSILINELGERLFDHKGFTSSNKTYTLKTVELNVRDLGFSEGSTLPQIFQRANQLGLSLCPLELGPYLRLEYLDQPEGNLGNLSQLHQAPYGSVTIASDIVSEDDDFPKGFYVRRIDDMLWLRGYVADHLHIWAPEDRFVFCHKSL